MAPERRPRLLASAPVSTLVPAPPGAGEGAPAPASRPHCLRLAHPRPDRRSGGGGRAGGARVPHQQQHRSDGHRGQHVVGDRDHVPRRGRLRRGRPHRRARASMGGPVGRDLRGLHRLRRAVHPVVGAAGLVVVRRQPAAVVSGRLRRRGRAGADGAATVARAGGGGGHARQPCSALGPCWPRCSPRRWRPPTTTDACWRRSATGTRSACAPRWASRRRCGRPPAPRARRSCAR